MRHIGRIQFNLHLHVRAVFLFDAKYCITLASMLWWHFVYGRSSNQHAQKLDVESVALFNLQRVLFSHVHLYLVFARCNELTFLIDFVFLSRKYME